MKMSALIFLVLSPLVVLSSTAPSGVNRRTDCVLHRGGGIKGPGERAPLPFLTGSNSWSVVGKPNFITAFKHMISCSERG